jgi:hypothetical protein
MKTVSRFVQKFTSLIACVLSCFDRVIFKGHLSLSRVKEVEKFIDYILNMRRADFFKRRAPAFAQRLVDHGKKYAARAGRPYEYRGGKFDKDQGARQILRKQPVSHGLICVFCTKERCPTFRLQYGKDRPQVVPDNIPQRVLYFYFLDADLGLIHVRLQTWLPYTLQIAVNGHDYVARQMAKKQLGFVQQDNAFTRLDEPAQAQKLADKFAKLKWPQRLQRYALQVNPLLHDVLKGLSYYWVTDQAEYATDLLFTNKKSLVGLFAKLLEYAVVNFSAKDILGFLGRKLHSQFEGEVLTDYKTEREPGGRIKHHMKKNWLKMYDKFGLILRIETVINQPGEFTIYRECQHRDGTRSWGYYPMPKGVGNLHHYQHHALACNQRYLQALAVVDDPAPAYQELAKLTEPTKVEQRSYAGFNPARREDLRLFAAVLDGDHITQGFRNKDIRKVFYTSTQDPTATHQQSAAVGRLLKRLHLRGYVAKIPHSRRWKATDYGRRILGDAVAVYRRYWPEQFGNQAA